MSFSLLHDPGVYRELRPEPYFRPPSIISRRTAHEADDFSPPLPSSWTSRPCAPVLSHLLYIGNGAASSEVMTTRSAPSRIVPRVVKPMLARRPFDPPDHLYEPKWDGIRALAFVEGGRLRLLSRNSRDITSTFPELADLPSRVNAEAAVLDGEFVCLDSSGHPSYTRLQERLRAPGTSLAGSVPVHFIAFDLLYLGGRPVMGEPLVDRKRPSSETSWLQTSWSKPATSSRAKAKPSSRRPAS